MKLTTTQIEALAAIYAMQPATLAAIAMYTGNQPTSGSDTMLQLVGMGLVERIKSPPGPVGERGENRAGKRPYMYRLTETGVLPAFHYHRAQECLDQGEKHGIEKPNRAMVARVTRKNI